ncbi:two-component system chemotaxis sensor kinase CheA [Constrictibacter sp. MBR-5]|jgi:two-component system chemotaxis sensor kinase CheA|uniref:chemotaxis protein CheW n=1 Tax=Constrictibacter sp. MBR-5 TaxID=3156467 RepID=UPI00339B2BCC
MDDLLGEFLTETAEGLAELDTELVRLERNPNDPNLLGKIFRIVHTIKGTCGFLDLPRLERLGHAAENVLGKYRDGELSVSADSVTLILRTLDQFKTILGALEQTGAEPDGDDGALIDELNRTADGEAPVCPHAAAYAAPSVAAPSAAPKAAAEPAPSSEDGSLFERIGGMPAIEAAVDSFYAKVIRDPRLSPFFEHTILEVQKAMLRDWLARGFGGPNDYAGGDLAQAHASLAGQLNDSHFDAWIGHLVDAVREMGTAEAVIDDVLGVLEGVRRDIVPAPIAAVTSAGAPQAPAAAATAPAAAAARVEAPRADDHPVELNAANQSIRVGVSVLENLMTIVSELVLTRNQLLQMVRTREDSEFATPLQRLNQITSELQEGVMKTRMQPIGNAWSKLPRIVRDIAQDLGKKIELEQTGAETELDRQVLELIKDPLTHMVRNSLDHGIERPEERRAAGKPETGRIRLQAWHEGGHIILRIADDGRGLSIAKIREKIVKNGLASAAEVEQMPDHVAQQYIFAAGFSTAEQVTNVSGRGVGMDVVRSNIEKIGGSIEMNSVVGKGTEFNIKIPLTLAIVASLIVECAGQRFAIPQLSVLELVRSSKTSEHRIETLDHTPVLRLRDRLLPLVSLRELLELGEMEDGEQDVFIVVSQVGTYTFGIMVDRVFDTEEIVVKPMAPMLRDNPVFSGNTILGDGSVVMILDPNGIASRRGQAKAGDRDAGMVAAHAAGGDEKVALLLFRSAGATPKAVPLSLVARLEEIDVTAIEYADGRPVVQYRGTLMPLVGTAGEVRFAETGRQPVIVFTDRDRTMGLVVDEILDIAEEVLDFQLDGQSSSGTMGTAVINGKATEVIDLGWYLSQTFADWFGTKAGSAAKSDGQRRVLLVDDSAFFRNMLSPLLKRAGYEVTSVESADRAMALHDRGQDFDVIISDIDMPGMDGFGFAEAARRSDRWQDTPMVALSAKVSPGDIDRGRQVGFTDYVPKFDRDGLLETLSQSLTLTRGAA